ncbi:hypothetical protein TNIN_355151 [Trichonephila inaurata madagascariensis]|uniref:Uncharacterized protein n=1 Tax=Trichonephila inaurata madagascariensis TaxID=2747483 RepID=A0A8X6WU30_9ARAC|nr:hypothetical protein TNIN_355151 [Trichonephila inaurata madagascariensis]
MRPLSTILSVNCIGISSPPIGNHLRIASAMVADQSVNGTSALMKERILTNNTEKLLSNSPTEATYNVGTDKRDTTLDSLGEIVPYRGPMTRSRERNVKEL